MSKRNRDSLLLPTPAGLWGGLPTDIARAVAGMIGSPRGLAAFEGTCRNWRAAVAGMQGTVDCPWKSLALAKFPRLTAVVELMADDENSARSGDDARQTTTRSTQWSWKTLYRAQLRAESAPRIDRPPFEPRTALMDYVFTFEFFRGDTLLFQSAARGDEDCTPCLWTYRFDTEEPLDPELVARLGENPFDGENLQGISVRVIVHRRSDMKAVQLFDGLLLHDRNRDGHLDSLDYGEYLPSHTIFVNNTLDFHNRGRLETPTGILN